MRVITCDKCGSKLPDVQAADEGQVKLRWPDGASEIISATGASPTLARWLAAHCKVAAEEEREACVRAAAEVPVCHEGVPMLRTRIGDAIRARDKEQD